MFTNYKRLHFTMIMAQEFGRMSCQRLDALIRRVGEDVEGAEGFWQFTLYERQLICVADEEDDRMRVMTGVTPVSEMTADQLSECFEANYDRTLDVRYCISDGMLWAAFIHPLGSLSSCLLRSACNQVVEAANNFGTSYSSGELRYQG